MTSLRSRITLISTIVLALVLALAAIMIVSLVDRQLRNELAIQRAETMSDIAQRIADGENPESIRLPLGTDGSEYAITNNDGEYVASSVVFEFGSVEIISEEELTEDEIRELERDDGLLDDAAFENQFVAEIFSDTTIWEETSTTVQTPSGVEYNVLAFTSINVVERSVGQVQSVLIVVIPLLAIVFGGLIWLLTGRMLQPVDHITRRAEQISSETLHQRLAEPGTDDEIDRLAQTLNGMLDRLDRGATQQRQFVSDASHELQSPLTVMIGEAELAAQNHDHDALVAANALVIEHGKRMSKLIHDLLDLARAGESELAKIDVDLDDVLLDQAQMNPHAIGTKGVQPLRIPGEPRSLGRLIRNLIDNASRYAETTVDVACSLHDGVAVVTVDDDGPGIPADERDQIFERFTRLDASRNRATGGTGLGLAIAQAIAEAHGGSIVVDDSPLGGARLEVRLPA